MPFKRLLLTITFSLNLLLAGFAQEPTLLDHGGGVRTVEFSPVNNQLLVSAGESSIIKLWNLRSGKVKTLSDHTSRVNSVAFSPNGRLLASGSDDWTFRLWNVSQEKNIATLETVTNGNRWRARVVTFSPNGQLVAIGGDRFIKLWDIRTRTTITTLQHEQPVWTLAFSPDGQLLAAGEGSNEGTGIVTVWDIPKRQTIVRLEGDPKVMRSVKFSSDNQVLASSGWDGQLKLWDVSSWKLIGTIPNTGYYEIDFSPDGMVLASTNDGSVRLWSVNGENIAAFSGPSGWLHPVDFSHDGTSLAVGAEDGIVRIWRINTSFGDNSNGGIQILHIDTYFQQLPRANSASEDNIPEPAPPPAVVRGFFELDPFYEQWIDVGGLPVLTSAKVNPYALKEAAWLVLKMIGHRPDVLRAMVGNKVRFSVIGYNEIIIEIPEYRSDPRPDFLVYRERGWGGTEGATASSSEENILNYPGPHSRTYNVLIHEFAHAIHILGLNTLDPTFDERLRMTYEAAMKKGLWQGTYASADRREYWAEGTQAWFHPQGGHSFNSFGSTRQALKQYDPGLVALLNEVYGNSEWRYTPAETRTHLPHLQGFDPQNSPAYQGWPELEALYQQLKSNPNSDGGGEWVNLKLYNPNQLSHLTQLNVLSDASVIIFVNFTQANLSLYAVDLNGREQYWSVVYPWLPRATPTRTNTVWLVKDANGKNLAVFRAEEKVGRAAIGTVPNKTERITSLPPPEATGGVSIDDSEPQVLITQSQRPPMYWVDTAAGTLHRVIGAKVETLVPSVQNATSLALDTANSKLYWTEKMNDRSGKIRRSNLDGTNVQLVKDLTSVPHSIAVDTANNKLYLTNAWGKIQSLNFDGSNFQPNLITGLDAPTHLALNVTDGTLYWTEAGDHIRRANLDGSDVKTLVTDLEPLGGIAIADRKLYWTEPTSDNAGRVRYANSDGTNVQTLASLRSVPLGITVGDAERKLYWTSSRGTIQRANLDGSNVQVLVVGLDTPTGIVLGTAQDDVVITEVSLDKITGPWLWMIAPTETGQGGKNSTNIDSLAVASGGAVTEADVAANGAKEGDSVGNLVWTLGEISPTGGNNVNDLLNEIGLGRGNVDDHSSYALLTLESATAQSDVTMRVGSDDSIKVWLNGEVVHNKPINRGADDFEDKFTVDLKQGDNPLLVKVGERAGDWSMFVGIDANINAVYKSPTAPVGSEDVNSDGIVNILDLVLISANFGKTGTKSR